MGKRYFLFLVLISFVCKAVGQDTTSTVDTASYNRFLAILNKYMETCVYIDTSDYVHDDPHELDLNLMTASSSGFCTEIVRLVVKGADINCKSWENATPLHFAVGSGKLNAAEILLLFGASTEMRDIYGKFPLLVAVDNNDIEMADLLIVYRANIDTCDFSGVTALHKAVSNDNFNMTDMLIFHNAWLDVTDKEGNTPLMLAVWKGYYDIADLLLQSGANPGIQDKKGFSPLMMAAQKGDTLMLSILIKAGADLYTINSFGYDALCLAIKYEQTDAVNFLLKAGQQWFEQRSGKADLKSIAMKYGKKEMKIPHDISNNANTGFIHLNEISFAAGGITTNHLSMLTGEIALIDPDLKAGIFASYSFYPVSTRVLIKQPEAIYQYRLKTSFIKAGISKDFPVYNNFEKGLWSIVTSLSCTYHIYSEYYGTNSHPDNKFSVVPAAGLDWTLSHFSISTDISYMKTPFYKISPLWVELKLSVNIFSDRPAAPGKKIYLYDNGQ
jgi:uncharacterized protein